jgi:hypothetical protein
MRSVRGLLIAMVLLLCTIATIAVAQRTDVFVESSNHPAIAYRTGPVHNAVADLDEKLEHGSVQLAFDPDTGYLRPILDALKIPVESQSLVFSQTSAQAKQIGPRNPRAVYFNDSVAVGWVRGADLLELAAHDRQQGVVFYTLDQARSDALRLKRDNGCLLCHLTWDTLGVPGLQMLSTFQMSADPNAYAAGIVVDHRSPMTERWGGWYVTGKTGPAPHRGNVPVVVPAAALEKPPSRPPALESVAGLFDTTGYPSQQSDVVALMVLAHQAHMTNLLTRVGWETRVAEAAAALSPDRVPPRVREAAADLVDYLLFIDEAPLAGPIAGSSAFAERFAAQGPRDTHGRSLRQLDLRQRLLRYPCSYMIYTPAFDALPPVAKTIIYRRMWQILSGEEKGARYGRLSVADRQAIVEILRDTKHDLPDEFRRTGKL